MFVDDGYEADFEKEKAYPWVCLVLDEGWKI